MAHDVVVLTHVLYPDDIRDDDHGEWQNPIMESEIGAYLDRGYEVKATSVTTLHSPWAREFETTSATRLVAVTTLVQP